MKNEIAQTDDENSDQKYLPYLVFLARALLAWALFRYG